jgi:UbiD family decarboxylase
MSGSFPDLRTFLDSLRQSQDLTEVHATVDPILELPEIHRRVIAEGGPALLFSHLKGSPFRVASNLFGTEARVQKAFGSRPRELIQTIAAAPRELVPPSLSRLWAHRRFLGSLLRVGLSRRRSGEVLQATASPPDLTTLPATKSWVEDGGAFFTLPLVYTEHPETREHNLGIYRMQRFDRESTGMHWQIGKGGGFHHALAEARGESLPVNVFFGGPPAALLGALAPLPENVPELLLSSLVLGRRLPLTSSPKSKLPLLADAEIALIGEVPCGVRRSEGPFGDHYGYYSLVHDFPEFRCKVMHHRKDAILPVTVVGKPRQEDFYLGDYLQDLLSPLFPLVMPGVVDLWSYGETGYHALSAAVVKERYKREAMASAFRILGEGQLSLTKFLLVLDRPRDLRDFRGTLAHVLARADFRTDLFLLNNLSMDTLDYAGPVINEGSKGVLLGLGEPKRTLPQEFSGAMPSALERVEVFCPGCLVIQARRGVEEPEQLRRRILDHESFADWPLLVLVDDAAQASRSAMNFLWTTFTRFNPGTDIHAKRIELIHAHGAFHPPLLIDARMKPHYPKELFCDPQTRELVDRRWNEYFPKGLPMGDSDRAHLD